MRVVITGSSGLAAVIKRTLEATPYRGNTIEVTPVRCDDITMNGVNFWGFRGHKPMDVLINLAHQDQAKILDIAHEASKSCFAAHKLEYLGYWISRDGIQPIATKVDAIKNMTKPKNRKALQSFIGLVNYYRDIWR